MLQEVFPYVLLRFLSCGVDLLGKAEAGHSVYHSEVHSLSLRPLVGRDLIVGYSQDPGSCKSVDILIVIEGAEKSLILRQVGEYPKLDLRIVGAYKHLPIPGMESFADLSSQFLPDRDVLQIGFSAADPAGLGHSLLEVAMDPSIRRDKRDHSVYVGRSQLGEIPVFQHLVHDRMLVPELLQDLSIGGISSLGLLSEGKLQFLKKYLSQLDR